MNSYEYKGFNIRQAPPDMFEIYTDKNSMWWGSKPDHPMYGPYIQTDGTIDDNAQNGWFAHSKDVEAAIDKYLSTLPA